METPKKKETRGRPKKPGGRKPAAQVTADYTKRVIEAGGTFITRTAIRDPELASKIEKYATERCGGNKNDVAREALEFFFKNHQ